MNHESFFVSPVFFLFFQLHPYPFAKTGSINYGQYVYKYTKKNKQSWASIDANRVNHLQ